MALRSSIPSRVSLLWSAAISASEITFRRAVTTEWLRLNADWFSGRSTFRLQVLRHPLINRPLQHFRNERKIRDGPVAGKHGWIKGGLLENRCNLSQAEHLRNVTLWQGLIEEVREVRMVQGVSCNSSRTMSRLGPSHTSLFKNPSTRLTTSATDSEMKICELRISWTSIWSSNITHLVGWKTLRVNKMWDRIETAITGFCPLRTTESSKAFWHFRSCSWSAPASIRAASV